MTTMRAGSTGAGGNIQVRATERFVAEDRTGSATRGLPGTADPRLATAAACRSGAGYPPVRGVVASLSFAGGKGARLTFEAENVRLDTGGPVPYVATVTSSASGTGGRHGHGARIQIPRARRHGFKRLNGALRLRRKSYREPRARPGRRHPRRVAADRGGPRRADSDLKAGRRRHRQHPHPHPRSHALAARRSRKPARRAAPGAAAVSGSRAPAGSTLGSLSRRASTQTGARIGQDLHHRQQAVGDRNITIDMAEVHVGPGRASRPREVGLGKLRRRHRSTRSG